MAVGFEADNGTLVFATPGYVIRTGDTMWVVGEEESLQRILELAKG